MIHWYQIRRLRGAVILILIGVLALLNQWNVLRWDSSWPLILIVLGLLMLAERAAWTADARAQQQAQEYAATMTAAYNASQPLGSDSSSVGSGPFIQSHPLTPDDPGREGR